MKLTKQRVKQFEQEQKESGTETALFNVVWSIAADLMKAIGVKRIRTSERPSA